MSKTMKFFIVLNMFFNLITIYLVFNNSARDKESDDWISERVENVYTQLKKNSPVVVSNHLSPKLKIENFEYNQDGSFYHYGGTVTNTHNKVLFGILEGSIYEDNGNKIIFATPLPENGLIPGQKFDFKGMFEYDGVLSKGGISASYVSE